jgi:Putative cell wall-binding domain
MIGLRKLGTLIVGLALLTALLPGTASAGPPVSTRRFAGADRYETARRIAEATFAESSRGDVTIVRGDLFPDALAVSVLAGHYNPGPILLTERDRLPADTIAELNRRAPYVHIFLIGDTEAISAGVQADLEARNIGNVQRIGGPTRYHTASRIAGTAPDDVSRTAFVVSGEGFADGMAAGAWAYRPYGGRYVLLTPRDSLHAETRQTLLERRITEVLLLGGTDVISATVEAQLRAVCSDEPERYPTGCLQVTRIAGRTRAETATLLADYMGSQPGAEPVTHVNLARGDTFPDALAGAPHAGFAEEAPILFTENPTKLGDATREWLEAHAATIQSIDIFGDQQAISDAVVEEAREAASLP